jgi:leucyl aminopeptidase
MKVSISDTPKHLTHIVYISEEEKQRVPDFSGKKNEVHVIYDNKKAIIYCGIGEKKNITDAVIRNSTAYAIQKALELKREEVSVLIFWDNKKTYWKEALEGCILGSYKFTKYKTEKEPTITSINLVGKNINNKEVEKKQFICECVNFARDIVNENAHVANPQYIAQIAKEIAKTSKLKIEILDEKQIAKKGLRLIEAVGAASHFPPRLVLIEYKGNPSSKEKIAIVGKGITFDSGGLNLKPTGHIETMRSDMAGAAAVLGTIKAIGKIKPRINIVGVCPLVHNAIGKKAYFPGDVYKSYSGKTVEIGCTDAEGRLILADAISYCKDKYKPTTIIDLATLTGGILVCFGNVAAGLFSNNDNLAEKLLAASKATDEKLWQLPIYEELAETIKSDIADINNVSKLKKGYASSITGAAFIKEFVGDIPWAHLDIAGTAFNEDKPKGIIPQFATGFGVRLLLNFCGAE